MPSLSSRTRASGDALRERLSRLRRVAIASVAHAERGEVPLRVALREEESKLRAVPSEVIGRGLVLTVQLVGGGESECGDETDTGGGGDGQSCCVIGARRRASGDD